MRTFFFQFVMFLVFAIPSQGQVLVQNNGYIQLETTIAINPNNSDVMAIASIEKAPGGQCVIWVSTDNSDSWAQKNIVSNASDPVIEFDNSGNLFFSYLHKLELEIYIIKSTNLGTNWSSPLNVSNTSASYNADKEWMTIDRNNNMCI